MLILLNDRYSLWIYAKRWFYSCKISLSFKFFLGTAFCDAGVFTWFAAVLLSISRLFLSTRYKKSKKIFFGLLSANFAIWVFTYDGFISLFPLISSALWSYGFFFLERIKLRVLMMMTSLMWLVYNSVIGSISGIINETMVQLVLLFTIYRMMHIDGGMKYYSQKIADILWKRSRPDYDRYIFIRDNLAWIRHKIGTHFLKILHYDLRKFFHRKKSQSFIESLQDKVLE